ncbi:hypothetical protein GCM10027321_00420 [Massilia terrae]|uniref:Lipoprotein n=1 Tax=Massilia terrae TaxID=1811224 RepID=A0ABT2CWV8_9BURK|nr:hypothetical protein [Massilia terrae]MCS0657593.1 hypothetical protein [Massilia terrae]
MKHLVIVLALAALGGCATYYPAPAYYGSRAPAAPGQWQTVSVTPVPNGTAAAAGSTYTEGTTTIVQQPVYTPYYVEPAPVYVAPDPYYWWPPVSIGLGFSWSNCCHRGWGGRGWGGRGFHGGGVRHR